MAVPDGLIPLLFPVVGVLSGPEPMMVPFLILKIPALMPSPDSFPEIYAPSML